MNKCNKICSRTLCMHHREYNTAERTHRRLNEWRDVHVKMSVLPKLNYRFNAMKKNLFCRNSLVDSKVGMEPDKNSQYNPKKEECIWRTYTTLLEELL